MRRLWAFAPLIVHGKQLLAADTAGAILLFNLDTPAEYIRRWRPGDEGKNAIPAGRPTLGFQSLTKDSASIVAYAIDNRRMT